MNINLARKWRSKQFDEIVGQPLAVRLVKNSLYRNLLFPVYLLSGTRGTGKTSTARIFAAALNCKQLPAFQKDPKAQELPCLTCQSCQAMQQMKHPDVIEIDAASHTGVDNVRQIIEAASFVPVLGGKKIYLVDEAHMLSKAAFNAFLKILEEPPESVVFMLITTDPHKIIQTVLSRCFQIYFDPIRPADVVSHLTFICEQEGITADQDALMFIAQETEGCMRDALNLLERLRAVPDESISEKASVRITKESVSAVLGSIDDERIAELLYTVVSEDAQHVLETWSRLDMAKFTPTMVWKKLVETLRRLLWLKQGVAPDELPVSNTLQKVLENASYERLIELLDLCYAYEVSFSKTAVPRTLLEILILKMVPTQAAEHRVSQPARPLKTLPKKNTPVLPREKEPTRKPEKPLEPQPSVPEKASKEEVAQAQDTVQEQAHKKESVSIPEPTGHWAQCLQELEGISDPLVLSIFKQSSKHVHDEQAGTLTLTFSKDLLFFKDWLSSTVEVWSPIIQKMYGTVKLVPNFDGPSTKPRPVVMEPVKTHPVRQQKSETSKAPRQARQAQQPVGSAISQKEVEQLATGSVVAEVFPGRMRVQNLPSEEGNL